MFVRNSIIRPTPSRMSTEQRILLEIGNSTIKVAHAAEDGSLRLERFSNLEALLRRCERGDEKIICAPVGAMSDEILDRLRDTRDVRVLDRSAFNHFVAGSYDTPETLGLDRILNLIGLAGDGIAISCGTAITIDAIASGRPIWGAIMPGFRTAAEGLHARVAALPLVALDEATGLPARSSARSVANGVILGTALAARALAMQLTARSFDGAAPRIVVTGGDASILAEHWSVGEAASNAPEVDELLLFKGMLRSDADAGLSGLS